MSSVTDRQVVPLCLCFGNVFYTIYKAIDRVILKAVCSVSKRFDISKNICIDENRFMPLF